MYEPGRFWIGSSKRPVAFVRACGTGDDICSIGHIGGSYDLLKSKCCLGVIRGQVATQIE